MKRSFLFPPLHVIHHRRREDTDPGRHKKACVGHEHPVRHRVQHEGMGSVSVYVFRPVPDMRWDCLAG